MSEQELDRLAADIHRDGLRENVEVTDDGRIISGHQRVRDAARLGWKGIPVRVRTDLADERAIELRLIEANRVRRQLDTLDQIRLEVRRLEIEWKREPGQLSDSELPSGGTGRTASPSPSTCVARTSSDT
jgi:ParB-like chromosome segregation protein Spo0J